MTKLAADPKDRTCDHEMVGIYAAQNMIKGKIYQLCRLYYGLGLC